MLTLNDLTASPAPDISQMSRVQKLAALLIVLGPESAAQILKTLDPRELETVSAEMTRLPVITQEMRAGILQEMSEVALAAGTSLRGGIEFTQTALEKAVGFSKASDILNRVSPSRPLSSSVQLLTELEPRQLFSLLKEEHVQTITLIASYLRPQKASELLNLLPPEVRGQAIERLATLGPTPVEVVEQIAEVLQQRIQGRATRGVNQTGGLKSAAEILNALNKEVSKSILTSLEERNAELGQAIRQKMFTFADLAMLDNTALQKILREVDMRDLALSLKKADDTVKAKLLGAISKRAAETVNDELSFMGAVKLKELEGAQFRIIEVVRRLEGEGEIDLTPPQEAATA